MSNIVFLNNVVFWFLPLVLIVLVFLYLRKYNKGFVSKGIKVVDNGLSRWWLYIKLGLITVIVVLFALILANPSRINTKQNIQKNGIDIVILFDVSKSMEANDLTPSRIELAKKLIAQFVAKLKTDRVGLVVFAGKPFASVPLTFDYDIVVETLNDITTDSLDQSVMGMDGTAIGDALLMANNLLDIGNKEVQKDREKVVLLFTDGDANRGVDPILAARAMKDDVKIYSIGIGSKDGGFVSYNIGGFIQRQRIAPLKEDTLRYISKISGGRFYRATDNKSFEKIFEELSVLEKHKIDIEVQKSYIPYHKPFVVLLFISFVLYFMAVIVFVDPQG